MKEIALYAVAAVAALSMLGYSVHMLIGGIVAPETERLAITLTCLTGAAVIGFMAWDVLKHRRRGPNKE